MNPGKLNLICPQGATFRKTFRVYDKNDVAIDLTGYTAQMQARKTTGAKTTILSVGTSTGEISITGNNIVVTIPYSDTELYPCGDFKWDIEITSPDDIRDRLIEGKFTVTPEVTK